MANDLDDIQVPGLDWERLYRLLENIKVPLPTYAAGEVPDGSEVIRLLIKVQSRRNDLDKVASLIQRRLGIIKGRLDVLTQRAKLQRSMHQNDVRNLSRRDQDSQIEYLVSGITTVIAALRAKQHQYEHAAQAVDGTMNSLETAKQTLNSVKQLILGAQGNGHAGW